MIEIDRRIVYLASTRGAVISRICSDCSKENAFVSDEKILLLQRGFSPLLTGILLDEVTEERSASDFKVDPQSRPSFVS